MFAVVGASREMLGQKSHVAIGEMSVFSWNDAHGSATVTTSFLLGSLRLSPREKCRSRYRGSFSPHPTPIRNSPSILFVSGFRITRAARGLNIARSRYLEREMPRCLVVGGSPRESQIERSHGSFPGRMRRWSSDELDAARSVQLGLVAPGWGLPM